MSSWVLSAKWLAILFFVAVCSVNAQDQASSPVENTVIPNSSPRATVKLILSSIAEQSQESLIQNFDTRTTRVLRNIDAKAVVKDFPAILDRYGSLMPVGIISNNDAGSEEFGLATNLERVGQIKVEDKEIPIILQQIEDEQGNRLWLVSQQTIVALSAIPSGVLTSKINQILPQTLVDTIWKGAPIGQWLSMPILLLVSIAIGWLAATLIRRSANPIKATKKAAAISALSLPGGMVFAVIVFLLLERYLGISILIRQVFGVLTVSVLWIALFIFVWSFLDSLSAQGEQTLRRKNKVASLSLIVFFRASAKVVLLVLAVILVLDSNGVDVTTGLAALGIGGIALALGAQKAIENVVGSVVIIVDQPLRVGDFCQIGDMLGTVEKIGLRSTRIRTLTDTLVTYPNGELSCERVENYTMRRKFLLRTTLNLRYETQTENMERLLVELRAHLNKNPYTVQEGLRVRFIGYGATSLDVEIFVYIKAANYDVFLERQESILLGISRIVESNGSGFAFPSQTLYMSRDIPPQ